MILNYFKKYNFIEKIFGMSCVSFGELKMSKIFMEKFSTNLIKFKPIGKIKSKIFYSKNSMQMLAQIKKSELKGGFKRTANVTEHDYHAKLWKNVYDKKKWLGYDSILDFVLDSKNPSENDQTSYIDNKICKISTSEYAQFRKDILNFYINQFDNSSQTLVELGCGWGLNLWTLLADNYPKKLEGYELSENGLNACREINNHFQYDVKFEKIDLTDHSTFPSLEKKLVFTFHVLEQLKHNTSKVIENILKSNPDSVIHFEPVPELYSNSDHEKLVKQYIKYMDYQDNLLSTLQKFEKDGKLIIEISERLHFAANPFYETCLIKWTPTT